MSKSHVLSLLLIFGLASMLLPSWIFCSGAGDCYSCYGSYYPISTSEQEYLWYRDIYSFLYGCDLCSPAPAAYNYNQPGYYVQPAYNQTAYNQAAYSQAAYNQAAYNQAAYNQAAYNQPIYNQTAYNSSAGYWLNEGNALYLAGYYDRAASAYSNAVKLNPSLLDGWLNLGNALYFSGRYQESLDAYDEVLRLDSLNANALRGKSQALLSLNRTGEASAVMEKVKALQGPEPVKIGSSFGPTTRSTVVGGYTQQ